MLHCTDIICRAEMSERERLNVDLFLLIYFHEPSKLAPTYISYQTVLLSETAAESLRDQN